MKHLKCIKSSKYFTEGKIYPIFDRIEDGYLLTDDENKEHYVSSEYSVDNFIEID